MYKFSSGDGFVEISENLSDMIKFVTNEPSVGLFYVQQHTQKTTPNLINLKNNIFDKSHEVVLHTEDLNDSITMIGSMKECGFPITNGMIQEIKDSLSIISTTKQLKRGLLYSTGSGFLERTTSWSLKSAKQRAGNFKWTQVEKNGTDLVKCKNIAFARGGYTSSSSLLGDEAEDLPLSSPMCSELEEGLSLGKSLTRQQAVSLSEDYDELKADTEMKFEESLGNKLSL